MATIKIGGYLVAENGAAAKGYEEGPIARHMQGEEIDIEVDIGLGDGMATIWTCDLTHGISPLMAIIEASRKPLL